MAIAVNGTYDPNNGLLCTADFTPPKNGKLLVYCDYSLHKSGGPQELGFWEQAKLNVESAIMVVGDLVVQDVKRYYETMYASPVSDAFLSVTINGAQEYFQSDHDFENAHFRYAREYVVGKDERYLVSAIRGNIHADPIPTADNANSPDGFLLQLVFKAEDE